MIIDTHSPKCSVRNAVDAHSIAKARKSSGLSAQEFAYKIGLRHGSSVYQIEKGTKPVSRKVADRFLKWRGEGQLIIASVIIPEGTILPDNAEIARCPGCGNKFIRMNKSRVYHSRACQLREWRKRRSGNKT